MAEEPPPGGGFARNPWRVALLSMVGNLPYSLWWLWQLFAFTKREKLPRHRGFFWILVPVYGFYVLYQQVEDLAQGARDRGRLRHAALVPALVMGLLFLSLLAVILSDRVSEGTQVLAFLVTSYLLQGGFFLLVQDTANRYASGGPAPALLEGISIDEAAAAMGGMLLLAAVVLAAGAGR